ncbi:MAG: hypothetical protein GC204_18640 [Chloroflexi bacterium]|nr:hypothetical protein [Chloroflexota bacterium]
MTNPISYFELDARGIEARLWHKPNLGEAFAVALPIGLTLLFAYLNSSANMPFAPDFDVFIQAARGNFTGFYYTYWSLPIFQGLALLPGAHTAYILWSIINVICAWFAVRVFGGKAAPALLSYQMLFVCFYGQITGVTVAGLALLWWSLERKRWLLAGVGAALALIKWQMGLPLCLGLLLLVDASWYDRLRVLLVILVISLVSLILYPAWPLLVIQRIVVEPPIRFGDISLWQKLGLFSLLLWIPPLLLPLSNGRRYAALCVTVMLAIPYYQQTGLLTLFVLPIGWFALLGNIAYIYFWIRNTQLEFITLVPLLAYIWILWQPLRDWISQRRIRAATA